MLPCGGPGLPYRRAPPRHTPVKYTPLFFIRPQRGQVPESWWWQQQDQTHFLSNQEEWEVENERKGDQALWFCVKLE